MLCGVLKIQRRVTIDKNLIYDGSVGENWGILK